jgi:hypothetical protein
MEADFLENPVLGIQGDLCDKEIESIISFFPGESVVVVSPRQFTTIGRNLRYLTYREAWILIVDKKAVFDCWILEEQVDDLFFYLLFLTVTAKRTIYYGKDVGMLKIPFIPFPKPTAGVFFKDNVMVMNKIRKDMHYHTKMGKSVLIVLSTTSEIEEYSRRTDIKLSAKEDHSTVITTVKRLKKDPLLCRYDIVLDQGIDIVKFRKGLLMIEKRKYFSSKSAMDSLANYAKEKYIRYSKKFSYTDSISLLHLPFRVWHYLSTYSGPHRYFFNKLALDFSTQFIVDCPFNFRLGKILEQWKDKHLPLFPCFLILTLIESKPHNISPGTTPAIQTMMEKSNLETLVRILVKCLDDLGGLDFSYSLLREWCLFFSINTEQIWIIMENLREFCSLYPEEPVGSFNYRKGVKMFKELAQEELRDLIITRRGDGYETKDGRRYVLDTNMLHKHAEQFILFNANHNLIQLVLAL